MSKSDDPNLANMCHRSTQAYAHLLDGNPAVRLSLTSDGFRACSGAKTDQITGTWPNDGADKKNLQEEAQITALDDSIGAVTLSIGGNDIGFPDFVAKCLFADCAAVKQIYLDRIAALGPKINAAYNAILSAAPNAHVYVLGYPELLPNNDTCKYTSGDQIGLEWIAKVTAAIKQGDPGDFVRGFLRWLSFTDMEVTDIFANGGTVQLTPEEIAAAHDLTVALDAKIRETVGTIRPNLSYVDPLTPDSPSPSSHLDSSSSPHISLLSLARCLSCVCDFRGDTISGLLLYLPWVVE